MAAEARQALPTDSPLIARIPVLRALHQLVQQPWFLFVLVLFTCAIVTSRLQVNSYDNGIHRRAAVNVYINQRFPFDDPIEREFTLFFHPIHIAFLNAPFVMFTERPAAFWNIVFIALVLIGSRRGWAAVLALAFVVSPPVMYVIGAANMPGITTAFGLIFLLADKRGPLRAFAWAMMAGRPQDSVFTLLYSAAEAVRQRDWPAFLLGAGLMLPTIITLPHWLSIVPLSSDDLAVNPGEFYSLSISINHGVPAAVLFSAAIVALRLLTITRTEAGWRLGQRRWRTLPRTEQYWLLTVVWLMLTPYYLAYMVWMVLLPVRLMGLVRTLIYGAAVFGIGAALMYNLLPVGPLYAGGLLLVIVTALLTPRLTSQPGADPV